MNIVIFSSIEESSNVARHTHFLESQLSLRGHRFVIVDSAMKDTRSGKISFGKNSLVLHHRSAEVLEKLLDADVVCYQIGDDFDLHGGVLDYLPEFPGLTILHGTTFPMLFQNWVDNFPDKARDSLADAWSNSNCDWIASMATSTWSSLELEANLDTFENKLWDEISFKLQSDSTRKVAAQLIQWFPGGIAAEVIDEIGESLNKLFGVSSKHTNDKK